MLEGQEEAEMKKSRKQKRANMASTTRPEHLPLLRPFVQLYKWTISFVVCSIRGMQYLFFDLLFYVHRSMLS